MYTVAAEGDEIWYAAFAFSVTDTVSRPSVAVSLRGEIASIAVVASAGIVTEAGNVVKSTPDDAVPPRVKKTGSGCARSPPRRVNVTTAVSAGSAAVASVALIVTI